MLKNLCFLLKSAAALNYSPKKLKQLRVEKLKHLISEANSHTNYYHKLYRDTNLKIESLDDLAKIPVNLGSAFRKEAGSEITNNRYKTSELISFGTSGSSGAPFKFYLNRRELHQRQIKIMRFLWLNGWRPWWRGLTIESQQSGTPSWLDRLIRLRKVSVATQFELAEQARQLLQFRPQLIYGVTSTLEELAEWMIKHNRTNPDTGLVLGLGETISATCRERFIKAFGHPGISCYGSNECGIIAWSCPFCQQFHFDDDGIIAEVVELESAPFSNEKRGRVLITSLDQTTTPFIRYDIGDLVAVEPLRDCPRTSFSRFLHPVGRVADCISDRQGKKYHINDIGNRLQPLKESTRVQFSETEKGHLLVRYVAQQSESRAERELRDKLGAIINCEAEFLACTELALENSGKFKLLKN